MRTRLTGGPRFLGQRDSYHCGPIALLNLDKWLGCKVTRRDLPHYTKLLGCCRRHGTPAENFWRTTGQNGGPLTYRRFKRQIESGTAAVVLTKYPARNGPWHYYLVPCTGCQVQDKWHGFIAINFARARGTVTLLTWPHMKWLLRHSTVWLFPRKCP